jgi:hypothetical protein
VAIIHLKEDASDAEETKRMVEEVGRQCLDFTGDVSDPKARGLQSVNRGDWAGVAPERVKVVPLAA